MRNGAAYSNAYTSLQLQTMQNKHDELDFSMLLAFSPVMQSNYCDGWTGKNFLAEQEAALKQFPKTVTNEERKDVAENMPLIQSVFSDRPHVLRSMPPLEFHIEQMTVPQSHGVGDKTLRFLYTHYDYYGKQDNRASKVFFSRAFELIATSLLALSGEISLQSKDEWKRYLKKLSMRPPFYCIHAVNPTKTMSDTPSGSASVSPVQGVDDLTIEELTTCMATWLESCKALRLICQKRDMISLISAVFNKVFSQLHLLRVEQVGKQSGNQEYLFFRAKRFEYMVLNAFASFMKSGRVVKANLAIDSRSEIIWDYDKFKASGTFRNNVDEWIRGDETSDSDKKQLFKMLTKHPVFALNTPPIISDTDREKILNEDVFPDMDKALVRIKKRLNITSALKKEEIMVAITQQKEGASHAYHKIEQLLKFNKIPLDDMGKRTEHRKLYEALRANELSTKK